MSYQVVAFTKSGVLVADGAVAAVNLITAAKTGEAIVFVVKTADNAVPAVEVIKNVNDLQQVSANVAAGNLNANVKESLRCPSNFAFQQAVLMPPLIAELHAC